MTTPPALRLTIVAAALCALMLCACRHDAPPELKNGQPPLLEELEPPGTPPDDPTPDNPAQNPDPAIAAILADATLRIEAPDYTMRYDYGGVIVARRPGGETVMTDLATGRMALVAWDAVRPDSTLVGPRLIEAGRHQTVAAARMLADDGSRVWTRWTLADGTGRTIVIGSDL